MNTIKRWIAARPFTAISLAALFTLTAAIGGFREDWLPWMIGPYIMGLIYMCLSISRYTVPLLLSVGIVINCTREMARAQEERPAAGPAGVAVVVVVVGGVAIYLMVRTCQRLFPKTPKGGTNEPPNFLPGGTPDCAGSWTYSGWVSCYTPMDDSAPPTVTLELSGNMESNGELRLTASRKLGADEMLEPLEFHRNLAEHGITYGTIGEKSYGLWGRPAEAQEVPIAFSEDANGNKIVSVNSEQPMLTIALERSPDMIRWTRIGTSKMAVGQRMRIVDTTTSGQMFYRTVQP
jgi:hypothetical protein